MSKPVVVRERTRYKYASAEEAEAAKAQQTKEWRTRNKEKYNEYQKEWRSKKKIEKEAKDKLLTELLAEKFARLKVDVIPESVNPPEDKENLPRSILLHSFIVAENKSIYFLLPGSVVILDNTKLINTCNSIS